MSAVGKNEKIGLDAQRQPLVCTQLVVTEIVRQVKPPVKHLHLTSQINSRVSPEDLHSSPAQTP